ncbi:MAG: endopeptidase La [Candidatus Azobacteroides pseudotrichonymphae]|jgi:ATP-dependent Lon protease|uniref:Lon protease n=2 Tax=Candidatus Azobacteroides TaxID=511434 RepID=B6YQE7_AZOPC|nr:ATP-dependent Lon protease [Candidatus Azobacteroides pseudotrichonymphae genomovar. CFP2]GMO35922.1 MAG: endopeptidase La [Candidatus Azobacteroides pseudotrichonymphae]
MEEIIAPPMNIIVERKAIDPEDLIKENPILPIKNMIFFPGVPTPISVARSKSLKLVQDVQKAKGIVGVFCQKDTNIDDPKFNDLYSVGLVVQIINVIKEVSEGITILLMGVHRVHLEEITMEDPYLKGKFSILKTIYPSKSDKEFREQQKVVKNKLLHILTSKIGIPDFVVNSLKQSKDYDYLANLAFITVESSMKKKQEILACDDLKERYNKLLSLLEQESQLVEIKESIRKKTQMDINRQQKEYFLQQEMKNIQEALGGNIHDIEIKEIKEKATKIHFTSEQRIVFDKELKKLGLLHPNSPDYSTQMNYVHNILSLPWNAYTKDNFNLARAKKILDKDHFGLEKVKDRIIEHLAVLKLKGDMKSPIICLYGPPGVGKTSLGKSIANALGRKYFRMSLGGLHDEAEIRGHRRTYIGAMPGRIIQAIQKAGSSNPVIILDEIDKVGNDYKGDPSAALLEVLDPEQNFAFHDNYLGIDFDLSKVLFIATANSLSTVSPPLLDRMELINVSGYIMEEKVEIALKHLLPMQLENHGISKFLFDIPRKTMEAIIEFYTHESGVRELNKKIAKILRKVARTIAENIDYPRKLAIKNLFEYLGVVEYSKDKYESNEYAGVVTGLAWTAAGGEILFIEAGLSKGKDAKLSLTGNLGDVMKESAILALEYIKTHASQLDIPETLENWNIHIHIPEGAIPKDGPSAGITMTTALVSAFTGRKVKSHLAMTGEMTLRGKVLPVGGIKEKILAAKRAGIKEIVLSKENQKHVEEINDIYLTGLVFHYVNDIREVLDIALLF